MENEIKSQKEIISKIIKSYLKTDDINIDIPNDVKNIVMVASGSSNNAALIGKYFLETISNCYCSTEYAAEFANSNLKNYPKDALFIFISQSGNSIDTVLSAKKIKSLGIKTLCITNNLNSDLNKICDFKIDIMAGLEGAIAATKTFTATIAALYLLALKIKKNNGFEIKKEIDEISKIEEDIDLNPKGLDKASEIISKEDSFSLCGFNVTFPLALEAALKIKETSYINTSSYPTGEFIHGHFAVLNKSKVLLAFLKEGYSIVEEKLLEKIKNTYKADIVAITNVEYGFDYEILTKKGKSELSQIINMVIALQYLALNVANKLNRDVDKPVGLDKIVGDVLKDNK